MLLLTWLVSMAHAEDMWITSTVSALRWPDKAYPAMSLSKGDLVHVLLRDGDQVRVRKDDDFGWVPAAELSVVPIEPDLSFDPSNPFPGLSTMPMVPSSAPAGMPPAPGSAPLPGAPAPQ